MVKNFHSPEMVELDYWTNPLTQIIKILDKILSKCVHQRTDKRVTNYQAKIKGKVGVIFASRVSANPGKCELWSKGTENKTSIHPQQGVGRRTLLH